MKFSLNIEYSEKEYLAAMKTTGSMLGQLLGVLSSLKSSRQILPEDIALTPDALSGAAVLPFPREVTKQPTEQEVEDSIVNEPGLLPADLVKQQKLLKKGEKAFCEFLHEWLKGIDMDTLLPREGAEQPDRDALLRSIASGKYTWSILAYVKECGGLQRAIAKVTSSERLGVELARFIVPPASISFYDLADLYEHHNPFNKDDDE